MGSIIPYLYARKCIHLFIFVLPFSLSLSLIDVVRLFRGSVVVGAVLNVSVIYHGTKEHKKKQK